MTCQTRHESIHVYGIILPTPWTRWYLQSCPIHMYSSSFEVTGNEGILMDMSESQSANDIQIVIVDGLIMI
jgi:hypothetical protein